MSDIELVIKISENSYKATCIGSMLPSDVENVVHAIKNGTPLEQESILDKIWNIVFPLSIMSTDKMEHEAIMQIAEMLEPLCLPESEG